MNQEQKQLPVPSLSAEQVQVLVSYANDQLPTKYGKEILSFIEKVALDLESKKGEIQEFS